MTTTVTEQRRGEVSREIGTNGKMSGARSFIIYDDTGTLDFNDVIDNNDLPALGTPHPSNSFIIATSYSIRANQDRDGTYEVSYRYEPYSALDGNVIDGAEPDSGVTAFTMNVGLSIIDIWKADPTLPASKSDPAREDIGGTLVSEGGYPISLALPVVEITISQRFEGYFDAGIFLEKVGKRNNSSWRGFPTGSVLFTGVDVTQDTLGNNEAQYKCAYDKYYHMRQSPQRDEDGNPKVTLSGDDPPVPTMSVYFKQPFKSTTDFGFLPF
jgi:hypothetical protein